MKSLKSTANCSRHLSSLHIANHPELTDLQLQHMLGQCTNLHTLFIRNCPKLSNDSLCFLTKTAPKLHTFSWIGTSAASDEGFSLLLHKCQDLIYVNLSGTNCSNIALGQLLIDNLRLVSLDISFCALTDEAFITIRAPLHFLNLQGCSMITDKTVETLCTVGSLRHLALAYNDQITPTGLNLLRSIPLKTLRIFGNRYLYSKR